MVPASSGAGAAADTLSEAEVLHGICHAFGSSSTMAEALRGTSRWIRAAAASDALTLRVWVRSEGGDLSVALVEGDGVDRLGERRTLDAAVRRKRPVLMDRDGRPERLAIVPLVSRGAVYGVIELLGPRLSLERRWQTIESVASQAAIVLRNLAEVRPVEVAGRTTVPTLVAGPMIAAHDGMSNEPRRVLVVHGQKLFADALCAVLEQHDGMSVSTAGTAVEAMSRVLADRPDVVLIQAQLPDGSGVDLGSRVLDELPEVLAIALTPSTKAHVMGQIMRAGFSGYLSEDASATELLSSLDAALRGSIVWPDRAGEVSERRVKRGSGQAAPEVLTAREQEILELLVEGRSSKEMARRLGLSSHTVRSHVQNILAKLRVHSRLEAATFALLYGLVDLQSSSELAAVEAT